MKQKSEVFATVQKLVRKLQSLRDTFFPADETPSHHTWKPAEAFKKAHELIAEVSKFVSVSVSKITRTTISMVLKHAGALLHKLRKGRASHRSGSRTHFFNRPDHALRHRFSFAH